MPLDYRADALDYLCERLSAGHAIAAVCDEPSMPSEALVRRWLNNDPGFKARYFDAMRVHALTEGQKILTIADGEEILSHVTTDDDGTVTEHFKTEDVQRSKLRVDARFKMLSKLEPQVFGEKIEHDHNVVGELAQMMNEAMNHGHKLPSEHTLPTEEN